MPARIAEAGNTEHHFALGLLARRGFVVVRPPRGDGYWALDAEGRSLAGSTALVLVGLLAILDELGDDWYAAPRVQLPEAEIVDLDPDALARLSDAELGDAREAFERFAATMGRAVSCGETREELVAAVREWLARSDDDDDDDDDE